MAIQHTLETVNLANGVEGLFVRIPGAPVMAYSLQFRSGSDVLTQAYPYQAAHTLEHVVEAGPDDSRYPKKADYLREIQKNGAWRNAFTGESGIRYIGDCMPEEILRILKLRLYAAESPKFTADIFESESGNVMEEMKQRIADYPRLVGSLARKSLSGGDWLMPADVLVDVGNVTLQAISDYHAATHTSDNLRFIISGDISSEDEAAIVKLFGETKLPRGQRMSGPVIPSVDVNEYAYEERVEVESLVTSLAMAIPRELNPKECAVMHLVNYLLCNSGDSRILGKARESGIGYSMGGATERYKTQTIWGLHTPISPANASKFFTIMAGALRDVSLNGVLDIELERAKRLLVGGIRKGGQTAYELMDAYSEPYFRQDIVSNVDERSELLKGVTSGDIAALISEFLESKSKVFSGVGSIKDSEFKELFKILT